MAIAKHDILALGRGTLADNTNAAIIFTSNNTVGLWSGSITYAQYNVVEFSGRVYRSKVAGNLNLQPDTNPNSWETLFLGVKDGDVNVVVKGVNSTIMQRVSGVWSPIVGQPLTVSLNDNQISATDAVVFLGSDKAFSQLEYTLKRDSGEGQKRRGLFNVLNDTISTVSWDHEFVEIGVDVSVSMFFDMSGGNVRLRYTSGNLGSSISLKYILRGWT